MILVRVARTQIERRALAIAPLLQPTCGRPRTNRLNVQGGSIYETQLCPDGYTVFMD